MILRSVFVGCLLCLVPRPALAWGPEGHKIVCAIAHKLLSPADRHEVDRLTQRYRGPGNFRLQFFTAGCTFADTARERAQAGLPGWTGFARFERWHFLNLPRTATTVDPDICDDNCVLHGIAQHAAQLGDHTLDEQARAEALLFLGHWVGDIHQPLHISYRDDLGGNEIKPISGGFYSSGHLHGVWDSGIISRARPATTDWWTFAGQLRAGITPSLRTQWASSTPAAWAQESYDVTIGAPTNYCQRSGSQCDPIPGGRMLASGYQQTAAPVVKQRLQQAGARLAALIARALHS